MPNIDDARALLLDVFGFDDFREGQAAVIETLLAGRPALAVFPTGAGKSLCYQLPALLLDGLTVVVSPLIALMKDQVDALVRRGVRAARLDSTLGNDEAKRVLADLRSGDLKILYVSPERLAGGRFVRTLGGRRISLLAIDEAHCISEWGHNFRPEYMKLAAIAARPEVERVLALTATATPSVARDIAEALGVAPGDRVVTDFRRPNLTLRATPCPAADRWRAILDDIRARPAGSGIVYVTLQKTAEDLAAFLRQNGVDARAYHAGMDDEVRAKVQDAFMASDSSLVVATIAFGMGIDKADIRYVDHANLPKSLENYAQEIGRAGRDGLPSVCSLYPAAEDVVTLENFTFGDTPSESAVAGLVGHVLGRGAEFDISVYDASGRFDVRPLVVQTLLTYLELDGVIEATGPFFTETKVQPLRPLSEIFERFDPARREFLTALFGTAKKGTRWYTINPEESATTLGESRDRIVTALNYLEEKGEVLLQVAGLRQGYRRTELAADPEALVASLNARFASREKRDIERTGQVLEYAQTDDCLTAKLLLHFGQRLDGPCGHCDRCSGARPARLPAVAAPRPGKRERDLVRAVAAEGHRALQDTRALTRFLNGLASPASTRARLSKHPSFGALADWPFYATYALAGEVSDGLE